MAPRTFMSLKPGAPKLAQPAATIVPLPAAASSKERAFEEADDELPTPSKPIISKVAKPLAIKTKPAATAAASQPKPNVTAVSARSSILNPAAAKPVVPQDDEEVTTKSSERLTDPKVGAEFAANAKAPMANPIASAGNNVVGKTLVTSGKSKAPRTGFGGGFIAKVAVQVPQVATKLSIKTKPAPPANSKDSPAEDECKELGSEDEDRDAHVKALAKNAVVVMPAAKGPKIKIGKPFKKAKKTDDDDDDDNDCLEPPKPSKKRTLEAKAPTAVVKIAGAASAKGGATVFGNFTEVRGVCPHCNKDVTTDQSRVIGTDAEDYGKYFHTDCSEAFVLKKFKIPLLAALIDNPFKTGAEGEASQVPPTVKKFLPGPSCHRDTEPKKTTEGRGKGAFTDIRKVVVGGKKAVAKDDGVKPKKEKKEKSLGPKRPLSGFMIFSADVRKTIVSEAPNMAVTEVAKMIGARWQELDEAGKQPYNDKAIVAKAEYLVKLKEFEKENPGLPKAGAKKGATSAPAKATNKSSILKVNLKVKVAKKKPKQEDDEDEEEAVKDVARVADSFMMDVANAEEDDDEEEAVKEGNDRNDAGEEEGGAMDEDDNGGEGEANKRVDTKKKVPDVEDEAKSKTAGGEQAEEMAEDEEEEEVAEAVEEDADAEMDAAEGGAVGGEDEAAGEEGGEMEEEEVTCAHAGGEESAGEATGEKGTVEGGQEEEEGEEVGESEAAPDADKEGKEEEKEEEEAAEEEAEVEEEGGGEA